MPVRPSDLAAAGCLASSLAVVLVPMPAEESWLVGTWFVVLGLAGCWGLTLIVERRRPEVHPSVLAGVAAVAAYGWLAVINERGHVVGGVGAEPRQSGVGWLPGVLDAGTGTLSMLQTTAVLALFVVAVDWCRTPGRTRAVLWGLAMAGAVVAALGLAQRLDLVDWAMHNISVSEGTPFASFGYHASAGAYLNATLLAPVALLAGGARLRGLPHYLALSCLVIIAAGTAAHVSKAAQVLTAVTVVGGVIVVWQASTTSANRRIVAVGGAVGGAIAALAAWITRDRWADLFSGGGSASGRQRMWEVAVHAWGRRPWFGDGPGNFKIEIPGIVRDHVPELYPRWIVTEYQPGEPTTIWMYGHSDPLQTLVEWGLIGSAVILTTLVLVARAALANRLVDVVTRRLAWTSLTVACVHSLVDFPLRVPAVACVLALWAAILLGGAVGTAGLGSPPRRASRTEGAEEAGLEC